MAYDKKKEEFDVARERALFYAMLDDPANQAEYKKALGPHVDLNRWLAACRDAVEAKPDLLAPSLRSSLLFAVKKAAQQTLRPDNSQGALVPRWNSDARQVMISWQPMMKGVLLLGRRAGVLKDFTAEIVFANEPFKFLRGDDPKIIHEWMPDIREKAYSYLRPAQGPQKRQDGPPDDGQGGPDYSAFWDMVVAAYCIVEGPDGSRTRRAMARSRLILLRDFARSRGGPWQSVFLDEMIIKAVTHFTMKHVDTVPKDEDAGRVFRAALDQDMDADLSDIDDDIVEAKVASAPTLPALSAPNPIPNTLDKLSRFEEREKVPAGGGQQNQERRQESKPATTEARNEPAKTTASAKADTEQPAAADQREQSAEKACSDILDALADAVGKSEKSGNNEAIFDMLSNKATQALIARLKVTFADKHRRIISACARDPIVTVAGEMQVAYPFFYDDVIAMQQQNESVSA